MKLPRQGVSARQWSRGTTAIEFAIVGAALLVTIFLVIDLSRLVYLRMTLEEGVRRSARLAAVCPIGDPLPAAAAIFADPALAAAAIPGASPANVRIRYVDAAGGVVADPVGAFSTIRFVRVSLEGVQVPFLVPFAAGFFAPINVSATANAESLGVSPGTVTAC